MNSLEARPHRLRRLAFPLLALALLLAASLVYERVRPKGAAPRFRALPCLVQSMEARLPLRFRGHGGITTDGDRAVVPGPPTLWHLRELPRAFRLIQVVVKARARASAFVLRGAARRNTAFDVARWAASTPAAVFFLHQGRRGIQVFSQRVGPAARGRFVGFAPKREQPPYVRRDLALARFTGRRPDLFVIDRNRRSGGGRLTVYSGESRFRRPLIRGRRLPVGGLDPAHWIVDVGRDTSARADIVFVRRPRGSLTGTVEVHVLTGASGYRSFAMHDRVSRKASRARAFAIGRSPSGPSLYSVGLAAGRVMLHVTPLTTPRTSPSC